MPRRRAPRKALRKLGLWAAATLLAALLVTLIAVLLTPPRRPSTGVGKSALIIDSLYDWTPNDRLLARLVQTFSDAGYSVKVIKGRDATVDAFRNLTAYDVVIVRCHGAYFKAGEVLGGRVLGDAAPVVFTGEEFSECLPLSCKYYFERLREEVVRGDFQLGENAVSVFALTPIFFEGLEGRFREGSVVIVASCYGLAGRLLADALLSKGVTYFISWDWKVSLEHMDEGLEALVEEAVAKGVGWVKAVENVNNRLGPDPLGGGRLRLVSTSG
ncbi:MAG: hypothetical protein QXT79_04795 [Thermofilaceae archaeon]